MIEKRHYCSGTNPPNQIVPGSSWECPYCKTDINAPLNFSDRDRDQYGEVVVQEKGSEFRIIHD